jgi:hypothetical protein
MPQSSIPALLPLLLLLVAISPSAAAPKHAPSAQVHKDDTGKTVFKDPNGNIVTYDPKSSAHFRSVFSWTNHYTKPLMFLSQPRAILLLLRASAAASSAFAVWRWYVFWNIDLLRETSCN